MSFAQQAAQRPGTTFSADELAAAQQGSYQELLSRLGAQRGVAENTGTDPGSAPSTDLYPSATGYTDGRVFYLRPGDGAVPRDPSAVVDQVVFHGFGWDVDKAALRRRQASIQVDDPAIGHNPYKVADRIQQALLGEQATTHIITRRGDIYCLAPWNMIPSVNQARRSNGVSAARRTISIELESWYTAYNARYEPGEQKELRFRTVGLMPYTDAQLRAAGFLLRKLNVWTPSFTPTVVGITLEQAADKFGSAPGHTPGMFPIRALDGTQRLSLGGEFDLPQGWRMGDELPTYLGSSWRARLEAYHRGKGVGTPIAAWDTIKSFYDTYPGFSYEDQLFTQRQIPVFTPNPPTSRGAAAAVQLAANHTGSGFARSSEMQSMPRSGLYSAAAAANDAIVRETQAHAFRVGAARANQRVTIPVVRKGLAFDFGTGNWVSATSRIVTERLPTAQRPVSAD